MEWKFQRVAMFSSVLISGVAGSERAAWRGGRSSSFGSSESLQLYWDTKFLLVALSKRDKKVRRSLAWLVANAGIASIFILTDGAMGFTHDCHVAAVRFLRW